MTQQYQPGPFTPDEIKEIIEQFKAAAEANGLVRLVEYDGRPREGTYVGPGIWLKDGTDIPCLLVAQDELGNWVVLTEQGYTRQYFESEVM